MLFKVSSRVVLIDSVPASCWVIRGKLFSSKLIGVFGVDCLFQAIKIVFDLLLLLPQRQILKEQLAHKRQLGLQVFARDILLHSNKMPLTEAQRLAFLKGREKRMANLEKKKLEDKEALENEILRLLQEEEDAGKAPAKPKVARKPRKTKEAKVPVDVKIDPDPDPSEAPTEPETDPEPETKEPQPQPQPQPQMPAVSQDVAASSIKFDEDAIANKVVAMLLEKGVGVPPPPAPAPLKAKKATSARKAPASKPNDRTNPNNSGFSQSFPPAAASFSWM